MISLDLLGGERPQVVITAHGADDVGAWARLNEALARGVLGGSSRRLQVHLDVLLSELEVLREIRLTFQTQFEIGPELQRRLVDLAATRRRREEALDRPTESPAALTDELVRLGFQRPLKPFQLENLARIVALPHAADFSVPGAGKTTTALANFALQRGRGLVRRALVVAPLAAFTAWKEDAEACFKTPPRVAVHLGPGQPFDSRADILVTNYHRVAADYDRIRGWVGELDSQLILDEAHRAKRGFDGLHGRAVLDLAFAAARRDVLTGTPAPQGAFDLVALIRFLYPGQAQQILPGEAFVERLGRDPRVLLDTHAAMRRYFVRTRKSELRLPPTEKVVVCRPMDVVQRAIYAALVGRYRGSFSLATEDRRTLRDLGRIVMYLLEAATNPMLLLSGADADDGAGFQHPPLEVKNDERIMDLLHRYPTVETPWKYEHIKSLVADASTRGEKVLVWSSFVRNLKYLAVELTQWNPAVVHGGIPPQDGAPPSAPVVREQELDRFRHDPHCSVLLANPAACGEGVSLHHWCHHAVYLDRTFNAGHFLQSEDRIHRLGLAEGTLTKFTFLISEGSIDTAVDRRLADKIRALSVLMDDPGLVQVSLPETDEDSSDLPAFDDDMGAIAQHVLDPAP